MKYTLEIPDEEAAFITEVIRRLSAAVKLTPARKTKAGAVAADTTDYLMSSRANRERLLAAMDEVERGQTTPHDLLES